jgi:CDP-diacylglycerol--glycerol-3-phosphate 3-phosphatidyltransferase
MKFNSAVPGIWLSPGASDLNPVLSLFGSTNLNSRSANLDMELSFLMLTSSPQLRERLKDEVDGLRAFTVPWQGAGRHVRRRTEVIVDLVGGML